MALDNNTQLVYTDKITIKNWFKTGLKPKQDQFWAQFDSYWHKSESLPISSISGLGDLIDGKAETEHTHTEYATNDATSLTADNVTVWQQKLGVADLKFDDQAITITQDYTDFGLQAGATINAFNNAIYQSVGNKLDAPTENATNEYVLMADGSTVAKSDFGKVDTVNNINPDENKNVNVGLDDVLKYNNKTDRDLVIEKNIGVNLKSISTLSSYGFDTVSKLNDEVKSGGSFNYNGISFGSMSVNYSDVKGKFRVLADENKMCKIDLQSGFNGRGLEMGFSTTWGSSYYGFHNSGSKNYIRMIPENLDPEDKYLITVPAKTGTIALTSDIQDIFSKPTHWTNASQRFSGLVDKSADATYNQFALFDSNGNLAKASQIANAFEAGLKNTTAEQGLRIGQLLNGGVGSSGAMSVNTISPPLVQNQFNSVEYVLLRGANLNLASTQRKIEILKSSDNSVVVTIPDNQIIDMGNGIDLTFYYNFHNFALGDYKIRLTSGAKVYITTLTLKVVASIEDINTNSIVWEKIVNTSASISTENNAVGSSFVLSSLAGENGTIPIVSFKSSEIFAQGEDFYIEMKITAPNSPSGAATSTSTRANIGIGYSSTTNALVNKNILFTQVSLYSVQGVSYTNNTTQVEAGFGPFSYSIIIIKTGNLFRTIVGTNTQQTTLSNNAGYSIFLEIPSFSRAYTIQGQIVKAFKLT